MRWQSFIRFLPGLKRRGLKFVQSRYVLALFVTLFTALSSAYSQDAKEMISTSKLPPQSTPFIPSSVILNPALPSLKIGLMPQSAEQKSSDADLSQYEQLIKDCLDELDDKDRLIDDYDKALNEALADYRSAIVMIETQQKRINTLILTRNICIGISVGTVLTMIVFSFVNN